MQNDLFYRLDKLGLLANACIPRINAGGCGAFAYFVCAALQARGFDAEPALPYKPYPISVLKNGIASGDWTEMAGWNWHIAVRIREGGKKYIYDSDGWELERPGWWHPKSISCEELKVMVDEVELWNDFFDRNYIPRMEKLVRIAFRGL